MKIAFFGIEPAEQGMFAEAFPGQEVLFVNEKLDAKTAQKVPDAEIICLFVNSTVDKEVIDAFPGLKYIATRSTGYDHIDCEYAKSRGILVSNVPGYGSYTVAEFAFSLILNLSRKIIMANSRVKGGDFGQTADMEGFDLHGKTLGVIGTGRIGKNVIRIARGFSMEVIAADPHPDLQFAKESGFEYKNLNEVIAGADILTLHCPYTKENHHLLNRDNIATMKKGAYVVNTARGELVDTAALVWGLTEGIIAGAGLDVLEEERALREGRESPVIEMDKNLAGMQNVIVTPHIAFYSREALAEIHKVTMENIRNFLNGSPANIVG